MRDIKEYNGESMEQVIWRMTDVIAECLVNSDSESGASVADAITYVGESVERLAKAIECMPSNIISVKLR